MCLGCGKEEGGLSNELKFSGFGKKNGQVIFSLNLLYYDMDITGNMLCILS